MSEITALSNLSFFKVGRYQYDETSVSDFRSFPRPHYCMGLIIKGSAVFSSDGEDVFVEAGDIIFVPVTSRYISTWRGEPEIEYISFHFLFDKPVLFPMQQKVCIQKVTLPDFENAKRVFETAFDCFDKDRPDKLSALGGFFGIMSQVLPRLKYTSKIIDSRIEAAIEYIDNNYQKDFSVESLAKLCNMSISHFYFCFKESVGLSPVDYKNKVCINHAMLHLVSMPDKSIEEISEMTGFYSSAYFRRVFKSITGQTPREYRKSGIKL